MSIATELIHELNLVLVRTYDAIDGYKTAYENAANPSLKALFEDQIAVRSRFADELTTGIVSLGGKVENSGSITAFIHRRWMDVKAVLTNYSDDDLVAECIRGELAACDDYDSLLSLHIPNNLSIKDTLSDHRRQLEQSVHHLRSVESIISGSW